MFWNNKRSTGSIDLKQHIAAQSMSARASGGSNIMRVVSWVILSGVIVALGYFGIRWYQSRMLSPEKQAQQLAQEVGTLILLPDNETPTIATVADPTLFRSQVLFRNAQTGDKVLVVESSKRAILYRPSIHKLIEVVPFEIQK